MFVRIPLLISCPEKLTRVIRMGVPPELRESVWLRCSGAAAKKASASKEDQYVNSPYPPIMPRSTLSV